MKKLLSVLFASMVIFSLAMPVFADDSTPTTTKVTKTKKTKKTKAGKTTKTTTEETKTAQ